MKSIKLMVTGILLAVVQTAWAKEYEELPAYLNGSMMPYDFAACDSAGAWGDTLKPVYVSYVARHGSRYLTSPKKISLIMKALRKARKAGMLSEEGERFYSYARSIEKHNEGKWGLLSETGVAEEQRLATDMDKMLPGFFTHGNSISISTSVPRVIMTMYQFLHSLEIPNQHLELSAGSGHRFDSLLCCFEADTAYARYRDNGAWTDVYEEYVKRHVSDAPARRLFKKGYENNRQNLRHLTMSIYGMMQGSLPSGMGAATTEWMSVDEFKGCYLAWNLYHYLRNSINGVSQLAGAATAPLLRRIIDNADNALAAGGNPKIDGYFGHAETLLPLLSLMEVEGCYIVTEDYENLWRHYQTNLITPLAANLALIFLKSESGEIYLSVRLNGRNVPVAGSGKTVASWKEAKAFWEGKLR